MRFSLKKYLISLLIISIAVPLLWYGYVGFWQLRTKLLMDRAESEFVVRYGYVQNQNNLAQTLFGRNMEEGRELAEYYFKLNNALKDFEREIMVFDGDTLYKDPIPSPVPLRFVGVRSKLYVEPNKSNSEVVKAYVFNIDCWGYFIAYIPSVNIHELTPPAELYEKFLEQIEKLPKSTSRKFGSLSPYGFYCN